MLKVLRLEIVNMNLPFIFRIDFCSQIWIAGISRRSTRRLYMRSRRSLFVVSGGCILKPVLSVIVRGIASSAIVSRVWKVFAGIPKK